MNEELKIIIKAVSDEAKKAIAGVKKELQDVEKESQEASKAVDVALSGMVKGAAAAVAGIVALTTAMAALGRRAQETKKGFDKLNTTFLNAGTTTKQASQTYKELFSFLGDHDKAIETAQSLALITSEEKKLAEWTNILQGAFAEMGDKLPIEGLAEAANETINTGVVTGVLADALNWVGVSEDAFNEALAQTNSLSEREALLRSTLNGLYSNSSKIYEANNQATKRYNESQANLNIALAQAAGYTTPLLTSLNELSIVLLTSFGPALQAISIYLTAFIQLLAEAIQWVGNFFGIFSSSTERATSNVEGYRNAMKEYLASLNGSFGKTNNELENTKDQIEAVKKATMGFDELNIISSQSSISSGGGGSSGGSGITLPEAPDPSDYGLGASSVDMSAMTNAIKEAKEYLEGALVVVGLIGAGIAAWKIGSIIGEIRSLTSLIKTLEFTGVFPAALKKAKGELEAIKTKWKVAAGMAMAVVGALMLIVGFSDAWVNGIDWQNFALMIGGVALAVSGIALSFGPVAAGIAALIGGISLIVIGIKDMVTNGATLENILTVIAGAIALVTGALILMGKENLIAAGQWIAHTSALVAHKAATIATTAATQTMTAIHAIFNKENMKAAAQWVATTAAMVAHKVATVATTIAQNAMTVAQTALNLAMSLSPLTWIVIAIAAVVAAFVLLWNNCEGFRNFWIGLWDGIVNAFNVTVDWLGQACKNIGNFFVNLWEGIKSTFSKVGSFFKDIFSKAWEGVKNVFSKGGEVFAGIKDGIVSTFIIVVNGLIEGINRVVRLPFDGLNGILNTIQSINIVGIKPFSWLTWRAPVPQLPKLAKGGILNSETLFVGGEGGKKEAVLPLEQNTGWMDILADRIASRSNTPSKIVLMLDGNELGWASIHSINDITRQTGRLQLATI